MTEESEKIMNRTPLPKPGTGLGGVKAKAIARREAEQRADEARKVQTRLAAMNRVARRDND